ncbi:MAG: hypothetical protein M0Z37_01970 [Nitrospiraceae bacterium]|nr:hypothetical protein [Nitrospiraceae bacterium]
MKNTATRYLFRTLSLFFFLAFLQSCGGSGGGGSSSPPGILFYALTEDSGGHGFIAENAISPSGQLYPSSPAPISTNGTAPVTFVLDPPASLAFALNSNSSPSSFKSGSIESYNTSSAQSATGIQSVSYIATGTNPSSMAIDPGGNYLVVADHGSGSGSTPGDVEIFQIGSTDTLSILRTISLTSTCPNPDKIVFPLSGSNGTSSDIFYVVCSSPELISSSSSPPSPALYQCPISGTCSKITLSGLSGSSNAISNMEFASNGTAFLPGETYTSSSYSAFLITCTGAQIPSCSTLSSVSSRTGTAPAGDFAIDNATSPPTAFIGNYSTNSSGISNPGIFFSCTTTRCASPNLLYSFSGAATFLATNPGQTNLYIVSTAAPLPTTTSSITNSSSNPGTIFTCPLPSASSCTSTGTTGSYPVGITFDPSGKFAFVPTWSGTISIFQVGANGSLTPAASPTVTTGSLNLQVVVP